MVEKTKVSSPESMAIPIPSGDLDPVADPHGMEIPSRLPDSRSRESPRPGARTGSAPYFKKYSNFHNIIGMPPAAYYQEESMASKILASFPMLEIDPAFPMPSISTGSNRNKTGENDRGFRLYSLNKLRGRKTYIEILETCGIPYERGAGSFPLKIMFQNEGPVGESWGNEYSESMFENIGNLNVPFLKELKYISGQNTLDGITTYLKNQMTNSTSSEQRSSLQGLISRVGGMGMGLVGQAAGIAENMFRGIAGESAGNLIMGSNIDFPMLWAGSSYGPDYSITVRLACPNPLDSVQYEAHVVRPLVKLLALALPVSDSSSTYTYPFIFEARCPGLFNLDAGYISSVEVIKGIDGTDIGYHQRAGTIDVRLTLSSLYSSMISYLPGHEPSDANRPSLVRYVDNLRDMAIPPNPYHDFTPKEGSVVYQPYDVSKFVNYDERGTPPPSGGTGSNTSVVRQPSEEEKIAALSLKAKRGNTTIDEYIENQGEQTLNNSDKNDIFRSYKTQREFT